jgi:hypothetical protein
VAWTLVLTTTVAPTFTFTPGTLTLNPGGAQQGLTAGGAGGVGGVQQAGGVGAQLQPAARAWPATALASRHASPPSTIAKKVLIDAVITGPPPRTGRGGDTSSRLCRTETSASWSSSSCKPCVVNGDRERRASMFHSNTEQLTDYWRARRSAAGAPARAAIDPTDFPRLVPQAFILGRRGPGHYRYRLAGGLLNELFGLDLHEDDFGRFWAREAHTQVQLALESACRRAEPLVLEAAGAARSGGVVNLEILLLPLAAPSSDRVRVLGLMQPTSPVALLAGEALFRLTLRAVRLSAETEVAAPRLKLAALNGRPL